MTMAVDEGDIQHITRALERIDMQIERIATRLDSLPAVYMARAEYEPRHADLMRRIDVLESRAWLFVFYGVGWVIAIIAAVLAYIRP